ncbi:MAG: transglutaminase-like domain-containing protein [Vicinamibacterales bacterium]|nr:transglutaminase-like domain-containing protein [Vicinamibacterales bacterium]MDP7479782.1 transglutaminase-like domain-containing protein [Vicinamibacterales bacterium]MDP7690769.1 transglutaminase-like domain-containing protein [Vicinamibacterales bacterium]HJN46332.1 transglutaminase-like domain-containing protein [Vicinamibacterales bacterium]
MRPRPLPRPLTRSVSVLVLIAWVATMAVLVNRSYLQASVNLATDLSRYGSAAEWRGVYYRGAKIGFTVRQVVPTNDGFRLEEDGQLEMTLLGATTAARIRTTAHVDDTFALRSFEFSLDPGTGPISVHGRVERPQPVGSRGDDRWRLVVDVTTGGVTRTEERALATPPLLTINLGRRLAREGLVPGDRHEWIVFDPATLSNVPVVVQIGEREVVRVGNTRMPAFRVDMRFAGLQTASWVTDTGEVVREESPLGILTLREPADRATIMAVPGRVQTDLLEAAAVVPVMTQRIDDPRGVRRLRVRLEGADLSSADLDGVGQTIDGDIIEITRPETPAHGSPDPDAGRYLAPEPLIESDDPAIQAEAALAVGGFVGARARAEALTRYVNGLLDKKPTVGFPSAREVLRTKIGDCNEHTALYVAMARALGIPTRIAAGLVYMRGAFYYHAWPEVYLDEGDEGASWWSVEPTLNQFPADGTHLRLARGGLERQLVILPLIGRLRMTVLDLEFAPDSTSVLLATSPVALESSAFPIPTLPRDTDGWCGCAGQPAP